MEPVHGHPDGTLYRLDEDVVRLSNGATMTRANKLIGYILAEYIDGDDAEPTRSDCVDRYAFNAIEKQHAYLLKTSTPHSFQARQPPRLQPQLAHALFLKDWIAGTMMVSSSGHITLCASVEERVVDLRCCVKYPVVACANAQDERPVAEGQVPRDVCERQ